MKTVARVLVCLAVAAGCVEQPRARAGGGPSQAQVEEIRRRVVSRTAPTPQHPLNITFEGKVRLLGYDLQGADNNTLRPGGSVTLKLYWHCVTAPGDGWRLFTHLDDANAPRTNMDNVGDARTAYQPERWRAGEYITDIQTFELPQDWASPVVRIHVGLWKEAQRLTPTPANATDNDRRARVLELQTGVQPPPPPPVPELRVSRAAGAITLDGNLTEAAWATAVRTGPLVNTMTGEAAGDTEARATARLLWDDTNLYVGFEVTDQNVVDPSTNRDDHLWDNDAVEVMLDPNGDGRNYFEFQVSPRNRLFDTRYDTARQPAPFGHLDFNPGVRSGVQVRGTIDNPDDNDNGYTAEIAIPWADVNQGLAHMPPVAGDSLRLNLFVMDKPKSGGQRAAAWSAPRRGDFHTLDRFGRIVLVADAGTPNLPGAAAAVPGGPTGAVVIPALPAAGQPMPPAAMLPQAVQDSLLRPTARPAAPAAPAAH